MYNRVFARKDRGKQNVGQDRQSKSRDFKPGTPEYKARVLITDLWRSYSV
jgi:hypothetical protein